MEHSEVLRREGGGYIPRPTIRDYDVPRFSPEALVRAAINRFLRSSGITAQMKVISGGTRPPAASFSH